MKKFFIVIFSIVSFSCLGQSPIKDIELLVDSMSFKASQNTVTWQGEQYIGIQSEESAPLCRIKLYLNKGSGVDKIYLNSDGNFQIIDSAKKLNDTTYACAIIFSDLVYGSIPDLRFSVYINKKQEIVTYQVLPIFNVNISYNGLETMFEEEEKTIEIPVKNAFNLYTDNYWMFNDDYDYKVTHTPQSLIIKIKPHTLGIRQLALQFKTYKPILLDHTGQLTTSLPILKIPFNVKANNLYYINFDKKLVYLDNEVRNSEEITADYNNALQLRKVYRIEDNEADGNLIAELFTIAQVLNGTTSRTICRIKPYAIHRASEGYMYVKDNGKARFVTNLDILEKPKVTNVSIMRNGDVWTSNLTVYPGEQLDVKIEGKGLMNAQFGFDNLTLVSEDTAKSSEEAAYYTVIVPIKINRKSVDIIMNGKPTSFDFTIKEYQRPTDLDFVSVNYGGPSVSAGNDKLNKPIMWDQIITDINLVFNDSKIDEVGKLYGKQYINIEVKLFNSNNDLIEIQQIDDIVVCPGNNSPRHQFYDLSDCQKASINLNDYLVHKTYKLDPFTQIQITIKHDEAKYSSKGYTKKINIILTRKTHFDIQVAFPAGLIVKNFKMPGYGSLSGISTSVLGQMNFYDPTRIGKLKPYSIGAGFIALNAFNFSSTADAARDLGIVVLGSITPVNKNSKFSIPIYFGGGYLLKASAWFVVLGPGIQVNF